MEISDPFLHQVRQARSDYGRSFVAHGIEHQRTVHRAAAMHRRQRKMRITGAVATALILAVGVSLIGRLLSDAPMATGTAPAWSVQLMSSSAKPTFALVYGEEAGIHLIRIPGRATSNDQAQIISARLAQGELHMISLSWHALKARASAPFGVAPMQWWAEGHVITAYQNTNGTGVKTW